MDVGNSAGTVKLRSKDPRDVPQIDFNFFAEDGERDLQALQEGIELCLSAFNLTGAPYQPLVQKEPRVSFSGSIRQSILDDTFSHHPTSSCRMGPRNSRDHCVDSKFRVNFVDSLRVVDGSVFPRTPGAFPSAPSYTISEKAFKTIIADL